MIHTGPIQGPILPFHRCLPNDTPAEKQRQNVKTALVSGSAAGLPLRCSWVPLVTGKSGWPSRHASRSEHRRAVPRPADVADGLPRQDALAVHAPLISRALRAQLRPEMSLQRGAPAWATSAGALFIIIYIGVSKPLSKFIFLSVHRQKSDCKNAPNRKPLCQRLQNCIKNSLRGLPRPDAPRPDFPGLHLIKQMPPSCDGRHALAGRV